MGKQMVFVGWVFRAKRGRPWQFVLAGTPGVAQIPADAEKEQVHLCQECGSFVYDVGDELVAHQTNCIEWQPASAAICKSVADQNLEDELAELAVEAEAEQW